MTLPRAKRILNFVFLANFAINFYPYLESKSGRNSGCEEATSLHTNSSTSAASGSSSSSSSSNANDAANSNVHDRRSLV